MIEYYDLTNMSKIFWMLKLTVFELEGGNLERYNQILSLIRLFSYLQRDVLPGMMHSPLNMRRIVLVILVA